VELRRALGITPQSERRRSGNALGTTSLGDGKRPKSKRQQLELQLERAGRLDGWHRQQAKNRRRERKAIKEKLDKMPPEDEFSPEELAELQREHEEQMERYRLGDRRDPTLESASETLMAGTRLVVDERREPLAAPIDQLEGDVEVLDQMVEERERYDFSFAVTKVILEVEKKVVVGADGERRVVSASTSAFGPPRSSVTWDFLAHMAVLVAQYAMPFNRLGKLLSTSEKTFTSGFLGRQFRYAAQRCLPVYLQLVDELADSGILAGDDTPSRVLEVNDYFAKGNKEEPSPWAPYCTREAAVDYALACALRGKDDSLAALTAAELGFEFDRRDGKGSKQALNTSTISGRSINDEPRSLIVLYRTHLGGFGNLLEIMLAKRRPDAGELVVQSDLATVNLVADPELLERFSIRYIGCMSHARRPFALYEHEDPSLCGFILHQFKGLAIKEHTLDLHGRNCENVSAVRGEDCRELWEEIRELCEELTETWSASTKLGNGARYVIRHYDKLTAYLDDPRLEMSNNFSERMLRTEKQIQASSMFRKSLEGRFALDILRSVLQTSVAAGVSPEEYLNWLLRSPADAVANNPEMYTPLRFATQSSVEPQSVVAPAPPSS
jgi:hypothetical protein